MGMTLGEEKLAPFPWDTLPSGNLSPFPMPLSGSILPNRLVK